MFDKIAPNVWSLTRPLKVFGVEIGCKMVIVRLDNGSLFVHSPVAVNQTEIAELKQMGEIKYIIAPNLAHYLYTKDFLDHFPAAKCYGCQGMDKKLNNIALEILREGIEYPWNKEIAQIYIQGAPEVNEIVFLAKKEQVLILTDLSFNVKNVSGLFNSIGHFFNDSYKKFGSSRHCRLHIKDKKAYLQSVAKILDWDFEKITMAHGENVLSQGKKIFEQYWRPQLGALKI